MRMSAGDMIKYVQMTALDRLGKEIVDELVKLGLEGKRFDGEPQKQNAPSTQARKAAKGIPQIPLFNTGELLKTSNYTVAIEDNEIVITTTGRNEQVLEFLKEKDYIYFDAPATINGIPIEERVQQIVNEISETIEIV